ncbi:MAG: signal transduction histidine kinase [Paraglaciecola sp.]|jgi:signal transduction histidine kinase
MQQLKLVPAKTSEDFHALSIQHTIEKGRAEAMHRLLIGGSWESSALPLIQSLEISLSSCYTNLMLVSDDSSKLATAIPEATVVQSFITLLENVTISQKSFGCHSAVFSKEPVFCEDLLATLSCADLRREAKEHKLLACWSQPVFSGTDKVLGVLTVYFNNHHLPNEKEQSILKLAADTAAVLMQHATTIGLMHKEKIELRKQVIDRDHAVVDAKSLLRKVLQQRAELQAELLELENMAALGTMMSSLTHEINTPIGVAITASSYLSHMQKSSLQKMHDNQLTKSELESFYQECQESTDIIMRNLTRVDTLINSFKQLSIDQHSQELRHFSLCDYVFEILLSLKPRLKTKPHKFCIDIPTDLQIISNPGAISQLLINLIMNSAQHAFDAGSPGQIIIQAKTCLDHEGKKCLQLDYQDNGKGMSQETIENIYKPFFTLAKESGGTGLGMHICNNIVMKVLKGKIDCYSEPEKGVHFVMRFPLNAVFER